MKKFLFLCVIALFVSCSDDGDSIGSSPLIDNKHTEIPITDSEQVMMQNNCMFSFNLMKAINDNFEGNKQFAFSPLSLSMSLSMLANGAGNETLSEIIAAIGFQGNSIDEINDLNTRLLDSLSVIDKAVQVNVANSLWLNTGIEPTELFLDRLLNCYYADLFTRELANSSTIDEVNSWCSRATEGKINNLLSELPASRSMLLVNALYFKSPWNVAFAESFNGKFTTADKSLQDVVYFRGEQVAELYSHEKFQIANIEYGNKAFCYKLVLPNEGVCVDECIEELASGVLYNDALSYVGLSNLKLTMPAFEISFKVSAKAALEALGINKVFGEDADFSGICNDEGIVLGDIVHACNFKVDKDGSEAAAATVSDILTDTPAGFRTELVVDRLFLFFVQEQSSGAILFAGKVGRI